jgi:hypothetical protein
LPDALALPNAYIWQMADTRIKKSPEQKLAEASEGLADYRAREATKHANMLRLRAERLAREAANPPAIETGPAKQKPRRKTVPGS